MKKTKFILKKQNISDAFFSQLIFLSCVQLTPTKFNAAVRNARKLRATMSPEKLASVKVPGL